MTKDFCTNIAHGFGYEISGMSAITGSLKIMYPELWIELAADAMTMRLFDMHNFLTKVQYLYMERLIHINLRFCACYLIFHKELLKVIKGGYNGKEVLVLMCPLSIL